MQPCWPIRFYSVSVVAYILTRFPKSRGWHANTQFARLKGTCWNMFDCTPWSHFNSIVFVPTRGSINANILAPKWGKQHQTTIGLAVSQAALEAALYTSKAWQWSHTLFFAVRNKIWACLGWLGLLAMFPAVSSWPCDSSLCCDCAISREPSATTDRSIVPQVGGLPPGWEEYVSEEHGGHGGTEAYNPSGKKLHNGWMFFHFF